MADDSTSLVLKTFAAQRIEAARERTIAELLRDLYTVRGMSQAEVAVELGVSRETVIRWMADYSIPTRDRRKLAADEVSVA